jgi:hypothetical protein
VESFDRLHDLVSLTEFRGQLGRDDQGVAAPRVVDAPDFVKF